MPSSDNNQIDNRINSYDSAPVRRKKKKKAKFTLGDGIRLGVIAIAIGVFIFALVKLINIQEGYKVAQDLYADIESRAVSDVTYENNDSKRLVSPSKDIDWNKLRADYPNTVGWIEMPLCAISYPIVQGSDNDYYLNHAANDDFSYSGAIFLDYRQKEDMTDDHVIIYGHHMKDGSMFCDLLEYDKESFYTSNEGKNYFFIYTPECIRVYEIFAICDVNINDHPTAYTIDIDEEFTITDYANFVRSVALYDTNIKPDGEKIVTLFTCQTDSQSNVRHMVHGRLVEEIQYSNAN